MNLFSAPRTPTNILPFEGEGIDYGVIFTPAQADTYLHYFLNDIPWKHDEAVIYGKHIITARKVAWYGNENYAYTYSNKTRVALTWTPQLLEIKNHIESLVGARYNSCLLNLYGDGSQGMGWHHDDEKGLGRNSNIASVSFGAERRFDLRHKRTGQTLSTQLEHGSLFVMRGSCQEYWKHQIPKQLRVREPRVNLTFRKMLMLNS